MLLFSSLTFCLLLFEGTFTSFFKDKKSKRSNKTVGIGIFLTIFAEICVTVRKCESGPTGDWRDVPP
jgi:hypothetical protein